MTKGKKKPLILLAICTRDLAVFDANCAQGIALLSYPRDFECEILVVENRSKPSSGSLRTQIKSPVHYFTETQLGLSAARNRIFLEAENLGAEWLALLDDDVIPVEQWLMEYVSALKSNANAKLLYGQIWYRFPGGYSLAIPRDPPTQRELLRRPVKFGGGNLLIHRDIFSNRCIRFDSRFDYCGGEDTDFRRQAERYGFKAKPVPKAIVQELITPRRATLLCGFHRRLDQGVASIELLKKYTPPLAVAVGLSVQLPIVFVRLHKEWFIVLLCYALRKQSRSENLDKALASLAQFLGFLLALCGYRGSYYHRRFTRE